MHGVGNGCSVVQVIGPVLGRDRDRSIVVLVAHLDDSGTDREAPVVTMAGYVSRLSQWSVFEADSDKIFSNYRD
jgi:hypothetical protein